MISLTYNDGFRDGVQRAIDECQYRIKLYKNEIKEVPVRNLSSGLIGYAEFPVDRKREIDVLNLIIALLKEHINEGT